MPLELAKLNKEIRILHDFDTEKLESLAGVFGEFLKSESENITEKAEIKGEDKVPLKQTFGGGFGIFRKSKAVNDSKGNQVKKYLISKGDLKTIYVSENPNNVVEVAKKNPEVISFLYKAEMPDEYNKQALDLVISAVNEENEELKTKNRKLLIDAAVEYQELSEKLKEISGSQTPNLDFIKTYANGFLEGDDWFKAVKEGLRAIVENKKVEPKSAMDIATKGNVNENKIFFEKFFGTNSLEVKTSDGQDLMMAAQHVYQSDDETPRVDDSSSLESSGISDDADQISSLEEIDNKANASHSSESPRVGVADDRDLQVVEEGGQHKNLKLVTMKEIEEESLHNATWLSSSDESNRVSIAQRLLNFLRPKIPESQKVDEKIPRVKVLEMANNINQKERKNKSSPESIEAGSPIVPIKKFSMEEIDPPKEMALEASVGDSGASLKDLSEKKSPQSQVSKADDPELKLIAGLQEVELEESNEVVVINQDLNKKIRFYHDSDNKKLESLDVISAFLQNNRGNIEIISLASKEKNIVDKAVEAVEKGVEVVAKGIAIILNADDDKDKNFPAIYMSEDPSKVMKFAEENPKVISFLFSMEMPNEYNKHALNLVISAVNTEDEALKRQNRKLLIDAAEEYKKLSGGFVVELNKEPSSGLVTISDYVQWHKDKNDWFEAVRSALHNLELPQDKELKTPSKNLEEDSGEKGGDRRSAIISPVLLEEGLGEKVKGGVSKEVEKLESFLRPSEALKKSNSERDAVYLLAEAEKDDLKMVAESGLNLAINSNSSNTPPAQEPSVPPLPNSSENFVSYDVTKKIINFKVETNNKSIKDKFHYNKEPSENDKKFLYAETAESNKYLSKNYTKKKEQDDILKLLQKASAETIKLFEGANLDDNFFIAVMRVASENCGIASIKQEEDFNNAFGQALKELNSSLKIEKYKLKDEDNLHKIAKYFSAQFQSLSGKDGYLTAREGGGNEVNKIPRRLFRVCTEENIKAFKNMQIPTKAEATLESAKGHQHSKGEGGPISSPELPTSSEPLVPSIGDKVERGA